MVGRNQNDPGRKWAEAPGEKAGVLEDAGGAWGNVNSLTNTQELSQDGVGNVGRLGWFQTVKDLECHTKDFRLYSLGLGELSAGLFEKTMDMVMEVEAEEGRCEIHILFFFSRQ